MEALGAAQRRPAAARSSSGRGQSLAFAQYRRRAGTSCALATIHRAGTIRGGAGRGCSPLGLFMGRAARYHAVGRSWRATV